MATLMELTGVSKRFGGLAAVNSIDLRIEEGELRGLIGPNGSGKTTLLNLMSGQLRVSAGSIRWRGVQLAGASPHKFAKRGVGRTFQLPTSFAEMSALQNVVIGLYSHHRPRLLGEFFGLPRERAVVRGLTAKALEILDFLGIAEIRNEPAGRLPLGYQRWLGIATALATEPKLLLLDEPLGGMNGRERTETMEKVRSLKDTGVSVLLVEHDVRAVLESCAVITVMNAGEKIAEGPPPAIRSDEGVIEAYLGRESPDA